MTTQERTRAGWVRIGADTNWSMGLLGLGLSAVTAALIAAPTAQLIQVVSGASPGWLGTALWILPFAFLLLGLPLLLMANRPASVDLARRLLKVGWRTVPFDRLRHVYRMPAGGNPEMVLLQLEITRGLDARLPLTSDALPDLTLGELNVLLAMLEQAPIEPNPDLPLHSPIADELGRRDESAVIADQISDALQPFGRVAYAKPTLLLEVQRAITRRRTLEGVTGETGLPDQGDGVRASSALLNGLEPAGTSPSRRPIMPPPSTPIVDSGYRRGFFGSGGRKFRRHRTEVEDWLRSTGVPVVRRYVDSRALGWVVVVTGLVLPWLLASIAMSSVWAYVYYASGISMDAVMWAAAASFLLAPLLIWGGLVLVHRARIRRFASDRSAVLMARSRGIAAPENVRRFFGAPFPESSYAANVYLLGIATIVYALAMGLVLVALGFGTVDGPYVAVPWLIPVGAVITASAVPLMIGVLRWQRFMTGELARAEVEWRLIEGGA